MFRFVQSKILRLGSDSLQILFKICLLFCYIWDISVLSCVWIWKVYVFIKIDFGVLICSRFVSIEDLNFHNKYLIGYLSFFGDMIWIKCNKNEVVIFKRFKFIQDDQSRLTIIIIEDWSHGLFGDYSRIHDKILQGFGAGLLLYIRRQFSLRRLRNLEKISTL